MGESDRMSIRMRVHDREPIGAALRRFKKLLERSGLKKELRKHEYYEKPCELRRRAELRKIRAIRKGVLGDRRPALPVSRSHGGESGADDPAAIFLPPSNPAIS